MCAGVKCVDVRNGGVIGINEPHDRSALGALHWAGNGAGSRKGDGFQQRASFQIVQGHLADNVSGSHDQHERTHDFWPIHNGETV